MSELNDLEEVRRIVLRGLDGYRARVYLFGSWAKGRARRISDIDVAVLPIDPLPVGLLGLISEELKDSNILYPVDLVDLSQTSANFRKIVETEGIVWKD